MWAYVFSIVSCETHLFNVNPWSFPKAITINLTQGSVSMCIYWSALHWLSFVSLIEFIIIINHYQEWIGCYKCEFWKEIKRLYRFTWMVMCGCHDVSTSVLLYLYPVLSSVCGKVDRPYLSPLGEPYQG